MDTLNNAQLKQDFTDFLFNENSNSLPRSKYLSLIKRMIDNLTTETFYKNVSDFKGSTNSVESIVTIAGEDEVSQLPIVEMPTGTIIKVKINTIEYQYKLMEGTESNAHPFIIRPADYSEVNQRFWKIQGNKARVRVEISPIEIINLFTTPKILIPTVPIKYKIDDIIYSMEYNTTAYSGDVLGLININKETAIYKLSHEKLFLTKDTAGCFEEIQKIVDGYSLTMDSTKSITSGDSPLVLDLFLSIIE